MFPDKPRHPKCYVRGTQQRSFVRLLDPRNITVLATIPAQRNGGQEKLAGHIVMRRFGDDEGAKRQIASNSGIWIWLATWMLWFVTKLWNVFLGGDKSASAKGRELLLGSIKDHEELYWDLVKFPERQCRWHTLSVAVSPAHQGKGIGKMLINEVIKRAEEEKICVGLEANVDGEPLYKKVGFELLGRFKLVLAEEERDRGGVMLWRPKGWVDGKGLVE